MAKQSLLLPLVRKYFESDPVAAAHQIEVMDESEAVDVLRALPPALSTTVVAHLQANYAAALLTKVPEATFREIAERADARHAAAILRHLSEETRQSFIDTLQERTRVEIQEIFNYPEDSVARIMSKDFMAFHGDLKVKDAIQKIRTVARHHAPASYVYVIDNGGVLIGVINMRDMMLAGSDATLGAVMIRNVFTLDYFMSREAAAEELSKRRYFAAPVVDNEHHLLGIIRAEQLIHEVQEEMTEDIQRMVGAGADERSFSPMSQSIRNRLPWLHVNLLTAFMAAGVVAMFEGLIAKITILAVFLPIVAGQGGNAGAQSLAIVMRGIVMREIPPNKVKKLIFKESALGLINGMVIGLVTAGIAWLWHGNPYLGMVVGLAMVINLFFAGLAGASIPLIMKRVGLDPAQCSSIILTTVTDVMGFFAFLGFAMLFQKYLI
ncbi:MAG: magnesium transporter [Candidatus Omnitrophica bacterium]|jgi:magnesium transporter|nr:magnesium transporter [Candidatus Omnitrophota bacterium]